MPSRYHTIAHRLNILPPELVHQILDDLPLTKILQLISLSDDVPYVHTCVLSHVHLSKIFTSPDTLSTLKLYFKLYAELCLRQGSGLLSILALQHDAIYFLKFNPSNPADTILTLLKAEISIMLNVYAPYIPILSRFAAEPIPNHTSWGVKLADPAALWQFWINLDGAETSLNALKVNQLRRIAQLLQEYPDMLRNAGDNSQEQRTRSVQHRIERYERLAREMVTPQILRSKLAGRGSFSTHVFPLVPYDRYLKCFLKVLRKYPLKNGPYTYDSKAQSSITKTLEGMAFVYIRDLVEDPQVFRTKYTPYSQKGFQVCGGQQQPMFVGNSGRRSRFDGPDDGILPLQEREFEWLEAFLTSCKFMAQMEDADWKPGVTVGQFWRSHTLA